MKKVSEKVSQLLLNHTPAYTKTIVQHNIMKSDIHQMADQTKLQPMIHYIEALQIHKEYLDFFQIGVVRDQRKKIQNVAKYVGLAIRDFSHDEMDEKLHKQQQQRKTDELNKNQGDKQLSKTSEFLQTIVKQGMCPVPKQNSKHKQIL